MEHATPSSMYKKIGEELIETMPELAYIKASEVKIAYLVSNNPKKESKTKIIYAETEKIPDKYKWGMKEDFSITVYSPHANLFNEEQKKILIFQQLLKIGMDYDDLKNEEKYFVREPDVVDFSVIINKYGVDWKETQQRLFDEL